MSNLSELLPSGGGQNVVKFTADGAISAGDAVALQTDGTVAAVGLTSQSVGSASVFESAAIAYTGTTFDSNENRVVTAYQDQGNSNYGTAVVGTVSGTSISFGTPVVFASVSSNYCGATFDSNSNKVVIAYRDGTTAYGMAVVGTVSGTSISFGTPVAFQSSNSSLFFAPTFDSNANKVVIAYKEFQDVSNQFGKAVVGTVSGTSISFGTPVVFENARSDDISATFDSNANKIVIAYEDAGNSSYGTAIVGTVSGTSISFGTAVVFESASSEYTATAFDESSNKVVIAYNQSTVNNGKSIVGTVSGTSISFGTSVVFNAATSWYNSATFDPNASKVVISYYDGGDSGRGYAIAGTVSGTDISFGTELRFELGRSNFISSAFDSNSNKVVIAYEDDFNSDYGTAVVYQTEFSSSSNFIGLAADAISDTATGDINVKGGINESQSGLTIGSDYYVQDNGTLSTTTSTVKVGQAITATTINMMDLT